MSKWVLQLQSSSFSPFSTHSTHQSVIFYCPALVQFQGGKKKCTGKSCQNNKVRSFLLENVPREEANFDVKQIRKVIFIQDEWKCKCWPVSLFLINHWFHSSSLLLSWFFSSWNFISAGQVIRWHGVMILMLLFLLDNFPAVGENKGGVKCRAGRKARPQDMSHVTALSSKLRWKRENFLFPVSKERLWNATQRAEFETGLSTLSCKFHWLLGTRKNTSFFPWREKH